MKSFVLGRLVVASAVALAAVAVFAGSAHAQNPHFIFCEASGVDNAGNVTVSFKEAGLGKNAKINYRASADATATYVCVNRGGNIPKDPKKTTVVGPVSATGTFSSPKNGQITASLTIQPPLPPSGFTCPPGQNMRLAEVSYSNLEVADTTNEVVCPISGTFSRTFIDLN